MKPVRALLLLFVGLVLAGCASHTASLRKNAAHPTAVALADEPLSGRNYWMLRDMEDGLERVRDRASTTTSRP